MYPQKTFNGLGCGCQEAKPIGLGARGEGKCGWVCRHLGQIGAIVAIINPALGAGIVALHLAFEAGDIGFNFRTPTGTVMPSAELPMTLAEEVLLDKWVADYFEPFYKSLLQTATNLSAFSGNEKIAKSNAILKQICAIKAYNIAVAGKATNGLSANAIANRSNYINTLLDEVVKEVHNKRDASTSKVTFSFDLSTVNLSAISFNTTTMAQTVNCNGYASVESSATILQDDLIQLPVSTGGNTVKPTVTIPVSIPVSNEPVSTIDPAPQKASSLGLKVAGGLLALAVTYAVFSKKTK
jgi:hypothetical protein